MRTAGRNACSARFHSSTALRGSQGKAAMFPRIITVHKPNKTYHYLVISESVRLKGRGSTTRNIANLGNVEKLSPHTIPDLIDGLIRLFELEEYVLSEGVEMVESLEHGSIIFWQKLWDQLGLSQLITQPIGRHHPQVELPVEKYIEMMVVNRCVDPLSKLGTTRWVPRTCYKRMKGYDELSLDVNNFYRSMDYLLRVKEALELALFERLHTLFSVNVKLTFYDITSSYFYTDGCALGENGYSRDHRPDLEQIVIGVVTSFEGYPIKHYVFEGNTKDETTVARVVKELKALYHIEQTTFVGDRGMITQLNLSRLQGEGFDYIMGVKHRQDELCEMVVDTAEPAAAGFEIYHGLQLKERRVGIKAFLIWKTHQILQQHNLKACDEAMSRLVQKIQCLTNQDEPDYASFKPLLQRLIEGQNSPLCYRIFRLIKKYTGRYEDQPRYIICLNPERKAQAEKRREAGLTKLSKQLAKWKPTPDQSPAKIEQGLAKLFEADKARFRKFFDIERDPTTGQAIDYHLNETIVEQEKKRDGLFILLTNRDNLEPSKVVDSYKELKEVEALFDDLKHFVDIQPIRHWLVRRVRAHVFLCILALLLKRLFEINYLGGKSTMQPLEEISKSKLILYKVRFSERDERTHLIPKVTTTNPLQKKYFNLVGITKPMSLERFVW